jgi:hypothetical protein
MPESSLIARIARREQDTVMPYGDDVASPVQRRVAFAAGMLALLELAYCSLVAGIMATSLNPRVFVTLAVLVSILAGNAVLLLGGPKPLSHWLMIASIVSIGLMLTPVLLIILDPYGR